jgi:hypothetical protein
MTNALNPIPEETINKTEECTEAHPVALECRVIPQKLPKPKRQCVKCGKHVTQKDGKPYPHFGVGEERHCYCTGSFAKHPEDYCQKCRQPNITWFAPNELWNKVTGNKSGLILCPVCFAKQAEKTMLNVVWKLEPEK